MKGAWGSKRRKSVEGAKAELAPIQQAEQWSAIEESEEVCHTSIVAKSVFESGNLFFEAEFS